MSVFGYRFNQFVFAFEIEIKGARAHTCLTHDIAHGCSVESSPCKTSNCSIQDCPPLRV
jgi:hypothetical protein